MESSIVEIVLIALGAAAVSGLCAWLVQLKNGKRMIARLALSAKQSIDKVTAQRDHLAREYTRAKSQIETLQESAAKRKEELDTHANKTKLLTANVATLRAERENTKVQLGAIQGALHTFRQQTAKLQSEFQKTQEFYKRELQKSFEKRKLLENDLKYAHLELKEARSEQEAFAKQVESSSLEHGSDTEMVKAAQLRLGQIDVLERNINKLEEENEQLTSEITSLRQEYLAQQADLSEMDELKIHNKQLVMAVEALEHSRKAHETDAERYKQQADESAKVSDTLRFKLEDLQKGFADIEKEQDQVLQSARSASVVPLLRNRA